MVSQKETAPPAQCLAAMTGEAVLESCAEQDFRVANPTVQRTLYRTSSKKKTAMELADYMSNYRLEIAARGNERETDLKRIDKAASALSSCADWLLFGEHKETEQVKLLRAHTCRITHLCLFCQARRASRLVNAYSERMLAVDGVHLHVTLTMPNTPDLLAGVELLKDSFRKLWARKKAKGQGPLRDALGAVVSVEITRGKDGNWHPHLHCLVSMKPETRGFLSYQELRQEWSKLTGGRQLRVEPVRDRNDLVEVLKYSVKPQEAGEDGLDGPARVEVWRILGGKRVRMLMSYGCYRGGPDLEMVETEEPFSMEDFRLFFFRWLNGHYVRSYDSSTGAGQESA